jgi:hypothetical protein
MKYRVGGKGWNALLRPTPPHFTEAYGKIFKDDVNGFSSTSDICFVEVRNMQRMPRKILFDNEEI